MIPALHWGLDLQNDWTPAFSTDKDRDEGLTISVNDVWGYTIHIKDYVLLSGGKFSCVLSFSMFDHFGLNAEDFRKGVVFKDFLAQTAKRMLAGFRAWYILQHLYEYKTGCKAFVDYVHHEGAMEVEIEE